MEQLEVSAGREKFDTTEMLQDKDNFSTRNSSMSLISSMRCVQQYHFDEYQASIRAVQICVEQSQSARESCCQCV